MPPPSASATPADHVRRLEGLLAEANLRLGIYEARDKGLCGRIDVLELEQEHDGIVIAELQDRIRKAETVIARLRAVKNDREELIDRLMGQLEEAEAEKREQALGTAECPIDLTRPSKKLRTKRNP
jgi:hypothetical protein